MIISSDSARRRNRDKSSLTSASAARRTGRSVVGEPTRRFGLRDDREDFDRFVRDVIEHPYLPHPKAVLWPTDAPRAFDPALAHPGRLVAQVPLEGVPYFRPLVGNEGSEGSRRLRSQDNLVPHSSQNIARFNRSSSLSAERASSAGIRQAGAFRIPLRVQARRSSTRSVACPRRSRPYGDTFRRSRDGAREREGRPLEIQGAPPSDRSRRKPLTVTPGAGSKSRSGTR